MPNRILAGAIAGATGTLALNVASYADMLIRGRAASSVPAHVAGRIADQIGLSLELDSHDEGDTQKLEHRQAALGALMGYANGVAIGVAYAVMRLVLPRPPAWLAGAILGSAAMAGSDYPATRLGVTDPRSWSGKDWAADVVPHMAYGVVTAAAFDHIKS